MDISPDALEVGREIADEAGYSSDDYRLIENDDLQFSEFKPDETFDFLLAFEVFTHLRQSQIEECIQHIDAVIHGDSVFYFTFNQTGFERKFSSKTFVYDMNTIRKLCDDAGFSVMQVSSDSYISGADEKPMLKLTF